LYRFEEEKKDVDLEGVEDAEAVVDGEEDEGRRRRTLLIWPDGGVSKGGDADESSEDESSDEDETSDEEETSAEEDEDAEGGEDADEDEEAKVGKGWGWKDWGKGWGR
jgi:hypothetical protein